MKKVIIRRNPSTAHSLSGYEPLLERIFVARGISSNDELEKGLDNLANFSLLSHIDQAVACLVEALQSQQHILIIGDFDTDGATSTALAVKCLKQMGATKVSYLVPNRFEYGYGLSPEIVEVAAEQSPDLIITVDNGISSHEGVIRAKEKGIKVLITDHHLPPTELPLADAIINPNLPGDVFPSKHLAGVGVIFYVMMALRAELRKMNWFSSSGLPDINMAAFLDLVALGTVADVVTLDKNNRILVHQGLMRMRAGKVCVGIRALLEVGGRSIERVCATDLGFAVAPKLNAAGRLEDMRLGIECLLAEEESVARQHAFMLDSLNKKRQEIEQEMQSQAMTSIADYINREDLPLGVCLFDETWHQGVVGIIASRIKDMIHRPVFAFAMTHEGELKGSGRSVLGLHLKDILEKIATARPNLISKFGGHAMAAGMSLPRENFEHFATLFNETVSQMLSADELKGVIYSDGELNQDTINLQTAEVLQKAGPWGQGFPEPVFDGYFKVISYKLLKEKHLKLILGHSETLFTVDAIAFNLKSPPTFIEDNVTLHVAYRLDINEYRGHRNVQLLIDHFDIV